MLMISLLLHVLLIASVSDLIHLPDTDTSHAYHAPDVIEASLIAPAPATQAAVTKPAAKKSKPKPARKAPSPVETTAEASPPAASEPVMDTSAKAGLLSGDAVEPSGAGSDTLAEKNATTDPVPVYRIALLPSAKLKFDIEKTPVNGATMHGSGTIEWQTDQQHYQINGDFGVLFITALRFKSTGTIESTGVAPELYAEKRLRRSETNTHFHRERQAISFSASTLSYPRIGDEQDRASIIWQMAAIGRGDADHFHAGTTIPVTVAGTRDATLWQIMIIGTEQIEIDGRQMNAWRLLRVPKPGSYDQTLEFWLAPEIGWYPVRLRYTEPNGDVLDMVMRSLNVYPTSQSEQ